MQNNGVPVGGSSHGKLARECLVSKFEHTRVVAPAQWLRSVGAWHKSVKVTLLDT